MQEIQGTASRPTVSATSVTPAKTETPQTAANPLIKTRQQGKRMIKTTARNAEKTVKTTAKGTVKATEKGVKTAKATAEATKATVKAIIAGTKALISALIAGGWIAVVIILIVVLLGYAVSLFGGGSDSTSYTPVSAEVEAYTPLIQKYAKQYGIPEYSIECGVQELKAALVSAEVENPIDMERIKLALQGYNFGNGYISWAKTNYGGYSYANAVEFSAMQAQRLGWEKYGDTQYPAHVLRYYPYGRAFTSGGNQAIVEVALTQLGNEGGQPYWSWYGFAGVWNGAPASHRGVPTSAAIWKAASSRNFLYARTA